MGGNPNYHLFPNLKKNLHRQRFSTDDELKYAVEEWEKGRSELLYFTGIDNLHVITKCPLTKAVNMLKNKCVLAYLSLV